MPTADEYRIKAADINARAKRESNMLTRSEYEKLALSYLRLADQAEKNATNDMVYETPVPFEQPHVEQKQQQQQTQQQQQPQPEKKKD